MFLLCLGAIMVICSMFMQTRKEAMSQKVTPDIPPSIKCVMILTTLYFFVYTAHQVTSSIKKLRGPTAVSQFITNLSNFLEKRAKEAIDFCPMLCILFLGTFMRALQITS